MPDISAPRAATVQDLRDDWKKLVGPQIASVTNVVTLDPHGVLHVTVATRSWHRDLSAVGMMMALLAKLPDRIDGQPLVAIRYHLRERQTA